MVIEPTFASADAELIARGIRVGGSPELVACLDKAVSEATAPLTADDIERVMHPNWEPGQLEEYARRELLGDGWDCVGFAKLATPENPEVGWALAARWYGWLPGIYATRSAALLAYGYVLGGETAGYLEDVRDRVLREDRRLITEADVESQRERQTPMTDRHSGFPPRPS